jgi:aquaporin Z
MANSTPTYNNRFFAEVFGTFVLVFSVGGAALLAAILSVGQRNYTDAGFFGVAFALGLSVVAAMFAVGSISGGHFNPAVTLGMAIGRRFAWRDVLGYIVAQLIGGLIASSLIYVVAMFGPEGLLTYLVENGFGSNGFGEGAPLQFGLVTVIITTTLVSAIFVWVFLGATDKSSATGFAPIAVGFALVVVSLIAVPMTGGAINPALSIANAVYGGPLALSQVWVFILFPIVGGLIAGLTYGPLFGRSVDKAKTTAVAAKPAAAPAAAAVKTTSAPRATAAAAAKKPAAKKPAAKKPAAKKPAARTTTTKK